MCRKFSFFVSLILVLCLFGNAWGLIWGQKDIGDPAIPGSATEVAGTWTIKGSGHDIWGTADGIYYVYRPMSGNGSLQINLISALDTNANGWSKVGPAIREDLGAGSKHAMNAMTGHQGIQFLWRMYTNQTSDGVVLAGESPPAMLRITRAGDEFIGELGEEIPFPPFFEWVEVWRKVILMNADVTIGMVVSASNNAALNEAVIDGVVLTTAPYEKPWDMSPADGSTRMPVTTTLSWMPGDSAVSHDVYFGTDPAALPLVATKALGDESYAPTLEKANTYYWQIVEQPLDMASPIMSFTTERDIGAGTIVRQVWEGIGGVAVADLTSNPAYPLSPTWVDEVTKTELLQSDINKENYGMRMIGYLAPELSGTYTFWIKSDDASQLWMSLSGKACDAVMLCQESGCCQDYDGEPEQKSDPVALVGGELYPIWILFKEGGGGDWMGVAWEGPDAPARTEIDGYFLVPGYTPLEASVLSPADGATVTPEEGAIVSLIPGETAVSHNVYFGTDPAALSLAATVAMPDTTATLPALTADTTYYLRIDADDGTDVHEGCVSSFTTAEWIKLDIGGSWGGSATKTDDCWTIVANGGDIWGNADSFHFVYQTPTLSHDQGTIIANVASLTGPNWWTKAGIMFRETLTPGSINTAMVTTQSTGHNGASFQWRDVTNGGSGYNSVGGVGGAPEWLKLERNGNAFRAYFSEDGVNWTLRGEHATIMSSFVRVGMAVTSHDWGALATAQICDVSITTPDPRKAWRRWDTEPADGATGIDIHATLHWFAGDGATQHHVYFSEDEEAVINRTVAPVTLPAETTELYVGPLDLTKTYYWCVDEVCNPVIPGDVYSFTVQNYRTIDDFEAYDIEETHPDQEVVEEGYTVTAEEPPEQVVIDPGYTIPGYTIEAVEPDVGCLAAHYEFEDNADDSTANANHGVVTGDPTYIPGVIDKAIDFDPTDALEDYVSIQDSPSLAFGNDSFSIALWMRSNNTDASKEFLVSNGTNGSEFTDASGKRYVVKFDNEFRFAIDDDTNKTVCAADEAIFATGDWVHVTAIRNRADDKMYIYADGVLVKEQNDNTELTLDSPGEKMFIGGKYQENAGADSEPNTPISHFYTGELDDCRIYSCALTEGNARFLAGVGDLVVPPVVIPPTYGPMLVHYEFEGDATDSSGNNRHGTEMPGSSGTPTYEAGMVGQAARFNGNGDHVIDDDAEDYLNGLEEMTVSMWIKSDQIDTDKGFLIFHNPAGNDQMNIRYDKRGAASSNPYNQIGYGITSTGGDQQSQSAPEVQTKDWQHVVMTWKGGIGLKLYLDGVLDIPAWIGNIRGGVIAGINRMIVGKGGKDNSATKSWDGLIDDVRIYSTVLSYGQIRYLAGEMDDLEVPPRYGPMIAGYDFEDGTATDMSGNNFHGTLLGDAYISDGVLYLDGNGDCVDLGRDNMFNPGASPISISAWARLTGWGDSWGNVIIGNRGENGRGWQLRRRGGDQRLCFTTRGCGSDDPGGNIDPGLNVWRHVIAIREGTSKKLYIDGVLDNDAGVNTNPITMAGHNVYIGARARRDNRGSERWFNGQIADVRVYNKALTYTERLYLSGYRAEVFIGDTWSGRAEAAPALESSIYQSAAHGGENCMRVEYTGSGAVSRLVPWDDGKHPHGWNSDFSLGQAQALTLWVKGDPENAPGMLFAQLTTVVPSGHTQRVMYDGDIRSGVWEEWNITLKDLSTGKPADPIEEMGLPITKIKDVGVGVIGAGGGTVYIDDIRLNPVRCVPKYGPAADLDDDCDVDKGDLRVLLGDWAWQSNPGVNGVRYEYYEDWFDGLDDFDVRAQMPTRVGVKANFDISGHRGDGFGYRFTAQVEVPTDGVYTFYTSSDDGSELYIDGVMVVDNDGFHGMQWRQGDIYLTAGLHDIMVTMFEWGGGEGLLVDVSGPGIPRMAIPNEVLFLPDPPDSDLNGDDIVNFLDYADILNSYIDAVLWPPMSEWLD